MKYEKIKQQEKKTFIIAEAGLNHNGKIALAIELINEAVNVGADAIKFQSFKTSELISAKDKKQYNLFKKLELSPDHHKILFNHCKEKNITFLSSPFDNYHVDLLDKLGVKAYKIASSELTNTPLLEHIAQKNKPIFLSTGMSSLYEVEEALISILEYTNSSLTLLHCVSSYPAHYNSINLQAMITMKEAFKLPVGYSDHSLGIEIPIAAVSIGASCIEKHFTIDKNLKGPDHSISLNPKEFKNMVTAIRNVEAALGSGLKKANINELKIRQTARKSLTAINNIPKGTTVNKNMFCMKRPGTGIPYRFLNILLGKKTIRNVHKDYPILWDDFF